MSRGRRQTRRGTRVRPYAEADRPAIVACVAALQEAERALDPRLRPGESMAPAYLAKLLERCAAFAGALFVAEVEGGIAGFTAVLSRLPYEELDEPAGFHGLVTDLVVLEPHRRRGLGRALLAAAEDHARAAGAAQLHIGVLRANQPARSLYLDSGFAAYFEVLVKDLA